jgi:hypothetical protein
MKPDALNREEATTVHVALNSGEAARSSPARIGSAAPIGFWIRCNDWLGILWQQNG